MIAAVAVLGLGLTLAYELTIHRFSLWGRQKRAWRTIGATGAIVGVCATVVSIVRLVAR